MDFKVAIQPLLSLAARLIKSVSNRKKPFINKDDKC